MPVQAIGAATSVARGISSGKGAKKAAQIQAKSAAEQRALYEKIYNQNAANFQSDITLGNAAARRQAALLGLDGGDGSNIQDILRSTPGYEFRMSEALKGVNSNAYASGMGNSGATMKALQDRAYNVADQGFNTYFNQTGEIADRGVGSKSALAGVSTNFARDTNAVNQNAANTNSEYQMFKANNFNSTLDGVTKQFGSAYDSGAFKTSLEVADNERLQLLPRRWRAPLGWYFD